MTGSRRVGVLASVLAIGLIMIGAGRTVLAADPCRADDVILGQAPGITGPTSTDWFNVFGESFDPTVPAILTFDVPVIPWSIEQPKVAQAPVSTFTMPTRYMAAGFKWTFRARDAGVQAIRVRIAGTGCEATTVVDFTPPATSTADEGPVASDRPLGELGVLLVAFAAGVFAVNRQLDRGNRRRR